MCFSFIMLWQMRVIEWILKHVYVYICAFPSLCCGRWEFIEWILTCVCICAFSFIMLWQMMPFDSWWASSRPMSRSPWSRIVAIAEGWSSTKRSKSEKASSILLRLRAGNAETRMRTRNPVTWRTSVWMITWRYTTGRCPRIHWGKCLGRCLVWGVPKHINSRVGR